MFGATLEGGWYLAGLREPRPELLDGRAGGLAARAAASAPCCERARELGAEVGMLRHERCSRRRRDAAALLADPLLAAPSCGRALSAA